MVYSRAQNVREISGKHASVRTCVVLVLFWVQETLAATGDSWLISTCSVAEHQSGCSSRRAPLSLQAARCKIDHVTNCRRQFSAKVQTKWTKQQDASAKQIPVC